MALAGAVVVVLNGRDEALILKRPPGMDWAPNQWALPGGKIEPNESPLSAAIRETKEETTLDVRKLKIIIQTPIIKNFLYSRRPMIKILPMPAPCLTLKSMNSTIIRVARKTIRLVSEKILR